MKSKDRKLPALIEDKKAHRLPLAALITGFKVRTSEKQRLRAAKRANKERCR